MSYQLSRLPYTPTILITLHNGISPAMLRLLFEDLKMLMSTIEGSRCLIFDFRNLPLHPFDVDEMTRYVNVMAEELRRASIINKVYTTFLSESHEIGQLAEQLGELGFVVPVYHAVDDAQSYLTLKIDGDMLRQGRSTSATTQSSNKEILRVAQDVVQQIARERCNFPLGGTLRLEAVEMNKSVVVLPQRGVLLGRRTPNSERPDIDLSLWAGYRTGVSRNHARLFLAETGSLRVIDLASSNGTFLNEKRLQPHQPYGVCNGDELRLGSLVMCIHFQESLANDESDTQPVPDE
ncbi:MAG: FHA domain-containing protein [Anaerolineales bacterium]